MWGATLSVDDGLLVLGISIHAPRVGRDGRPARRPAWVNNFNPRAPCGARREDYGYCYRDFTISIHAPRVGRDVVTQAFIIHKREFQSTRPVWGATFLRRCTILRTPNFNPRAPCGARPSWRGSNTRQNQFQSTRPVWGATNRRAGGRPWQINFNPRAPCGARLLYGQASVAGCIISIHAPRVGRDFTLSPLPYMGSGISIHAPRVGRDGVRLLKEAKRNDFNPRAPCGARPWCSA